jgi:hypothetical protein
LLFDPKRRNLGESGRLDPANDGVEGVGAAPLLNDCSPARLHADGVRREKVQDNFQAHGIAYFEQRLAGGTIDSLSRIRLRTTPSAGELTVTTRPRV